MKKAFMLVAAIALLAAPVFAEVEVAITGDATTSVGYNLDTEAFGMLSEFGSDITLTVGALDGESMGEGNWYGVIELTGASLSFDTAAQDGDVRLLDTAYAVYDEDDDEWYLASAGDRYNLNYQLEAPEVSAKITNGNVYVQLQDVADLDADYVDDEDMNDQAYGFADAENLGSVTIGGTFSMATIAVEFGTAGSYETAAQVDGVVLGANLGLDFAPVTVDVAFAGAFGYATDEEIGFAVKVVADVAPLTITAAFDAIIDDAVDADNDELTPDVYSGDLAYEAGLNVDVDLDPLTVGVQAYFTEDNLDTKLTVGFANDMITKADVFFGLYDIMAPTGVDIAWEFGVDLTVVPVSGIEANTGFAYDSAEFLSVYADVAFTELVDNVTFKIGWESADDMLETDDDDVTVLPADKESNFGQIYLSAGIEF